MLVLGIETSTTHGGIAIVGEDRVLYEAVLNVEVTHSERLLPAVDRALVEARMSLEALGGIAVSIGPGVNWYSSKPSGCRSGGKSDKSSSGSTSAGLSVGMGLNLS